MPNILIENRHAAQFVFSMANGHRSVDEATVDATSGALEAGTLLGLVTATSAFVRHDPAATDGSEVVAGILYNEMDDVSEAQTVFIRDGEVIEANLIYSDAATPAQKTTANEELKALGILVRPSIAQLT